MLRILAPALVVAVLGLGALWLFQRRLIYFPFGSAGSPPGGWEEVGLSTDDGLTLSAWVHPPPEDGAVVIVFNGNAGNRRDRLGLGEGLAAAGRGVVLVDYRGYGGNPGSPSETGLAADAVAAADWVAANLPGHETVYFGESLGAAVAIQLATQRPPAALVLRSPFTSLGDVGAHHYPFLPVRLLLRDEYPSQDRIQSLHIPIAVIAGSADSIIPTEQSRAIYEAAPGPKNWVLIEGADHNDAALVEGTSVVQAVTDILS